MPAFFSPGRVIAVFAIILLIYLIPQNVKWNPQCPPTSHSTTIGSDGASTAPLPSIRKDAHRFTTADEFLPHFKDVVNLPEMTVAEAQAPCTWPDLHKLNFQFGGAEWTEKHERDKMIAAYREEWQLFIQNDLLPWEDHKHRFEGRGIVIVTGQMAGLSRVKVLLRALKMVGSKLPVEINYWDKELTQDVKDDVALVWPNIYFNDLSADTNIVKTRKNYHWANYQLKTAALVNSRFAEPFLLDSDQIPLVDPESLYEDKVYREFGAVFWPDIARTHPSNPIWSLTNTECRMDEYEQESGQVIVDKRKFFYHLQLAFWFNNNYEQPSYYDRFMLGDKDLFRFSWHALKTQYGRPSKWLTSVGTLSDGFYCGHTFAQHHPSNGKIAFLHGGLLKGIAKEVMIWQREKRGGIFQTYKRSDKDEDPTYNENVSIKWDGADYLPNRPDNISVASCTDFYDVQPKPFDDLVPGFQQTFEDLGGYWMLDEGGYYD